MKKQKRNKNLILKIHEWLGLSTGLVVFIVSITGASWVFKDEIQSLSDEKFIIELKQQPVIVPTKAKELALTVFPGKHVHGTLYKKRNEPIEVIFYEAEPEFYRSVFLHPYTGKILKIEDHFSGFFAFVLKGHMYLWMPKTLGSNIVAISVFLFLITLTSGLILWWPNKKNRKQRPRFSWKESTNWKRKNFDLHAILGFYIYIFAFALAFTGSVMAYNWFYFIVFKAAGGQKAPQFIIPNNLDKEIALNDSKQIPMDRLIVNLQKENPDAKSFELHYPATDSSSIYVEVSNQDGVYYNSDYRFFDQSTLEEIITPSIYGKYSDATFADKVIRMNYDIHVGAIGGLAGKIIAFIISLLAASLPVTGFLFWYGKRYKKEKAKIIYS